MLQDTMVVAMAAVFGDDGRVLMVQEAKTQCRGLWSIPGGRADPGETVLETLQREVLEEAGVEIDAESLIFFEQEAGWRGVFRYFFKARYRSGEPKTAEDEHSMCARWFTLEEIATLDLRGPIIGELITLAAANRPALDIGQMHFVSRRGS